MSYPQRRLPNKEIRRRSRRQELQLAEEAGAKVQKASGSLPWAKGDVRKKGKFRAECKQTRAQSFTVTRATLNKIRSECSFDEVPILDVEFIGRAGVTDERFVVIPYNVWVDYQKE